MAVITNIEYFRVPPRWLFVKITDADGNSGWGEATLEGHTNAVEGALDAFKVQFVGFNADDIERIWQHGYRRGFYRGGPVLMSALSGIDIALWDLKARKLNVPIYELLGGKVRDKLRVYSWIGGDRPSDVEEAGKMRVAQGFTAIKMNATEDVSWLASPKVLDSTVERVRKVKNLGLDVGLDFHGRLHRPMAKQLIKLLEPERPLFVEEPILSENVEAVKTLYDGTSIPIALGERLYSRWDVKPFLEARCVDILQPDISHCGGISEIMRIAHMAEAYDIALAPHCPLGPIALAASFQVDAVAANFVIQEMSIGIHYNMKEGVDLHAYTKSSEAFDVEGGMVKVLDKPGLGIEIDEDAVRKAAVGAPAWTQPYFIDEVTGELREW
ncbi:uncharacterized protein PV09_04328 [Verruconis gallopava]|uniref:Mandelate racemase/muconate lactonizing enzyme C-terminal domain-containing protein n=1 Tax=Verruconis gallopava TaxID=253628 RepID=A0A0D2ACH6_9PEZI|nr:uncharacterized protein PV09_04328 [Verruconis gallopava]KIW04578.1 hypothetical protein PV09_04328 [Verruconis gallopava]